MGSAIRAEAAGKESSGKKQLRFAAKVTFLRVHTRPELKGNHITIVEFFTLVFPELMAKSNVSAAQTLSLLCPSSFPFPCLLPVPY